MSSKRFNAPKRPIDQSIIQFYFQDLGTGQAATTLRTSGMAETLVGLRISLGIVPDTSTGLHVACIVIVQLRDGQTANTIDLTAGNAVYTPEQDVLWFKYILTHPDGQEVSWKDVDVPVNVMRKLKKNDTIRILARASTGNILHIAGVVRSWYKQ